MELDITTPGQNRHRPAPRFTADQRMQRRTRVVEMYLMGRYQHEIADELGVSRSQVAMDLQFVRRSWLASQVRDFDRLKERELAKVDMMEREYWDAWQRSKGEVTRKTLRVGEDGGTQKQLTTENSIGDPRYLQGVERCIEIRTRILGLNAPTKIAPTDPSGQNEFGSMSQEQLRARIDELIAKRGAGAAAASGDREEA